MGLAKKGVFFTFAAIILTVMLVVSFNTYRQDNTSGSNDQLATRILIMDTFVGDFEDDVTQTMEVIGERAFVAIHNEIKSSGSYISEVDDVFQELVYNGTINSVPQAIMENNTFTWWLQTMSVEAVKMGINLSVSLQDITIEHVNPWSVRITLDADITIEDMRQTSRWDQTVSIDHALSILGLPDPVYTVETGDLVNNTVRISPYTTFVTGLGDQTNLNDHIRESYYIATDVSPDYLHRLEGNFSNTTHGIESLVNVSELVDAGMAQLDRSSVDYIYFGSQPTTNSQLNDTPSWFKLDQYHLIVYQAENVTI